jgi:hypothetical protein
LCHAVAENLATFLAAASNRRTLFFCGEQLPAGASFDRSWQEEAEALLGSVFH